MSKRPTLTLNGVRKINKDAECHLEEIFELLKKMKPKKVSQDTEKASRKHIKELVKVIKAKIRGGKRQVEKESQKAFITRCRILKVLLVNKLLPLETKFFEDSVTEDERKDTDWAIMQIRNILVGEFGYWKLDMNIRKKTEVVEGVLDLCAKVGTVLKEKLFQLHKPAIVFAAGFEFLNKVKSRILAVNTMNPVIENVLGYAECTMEYAILKKKKKKKNWMICHLLLKTVAYILGKKPVVDSLQSFLDPKNKKKLKDSPMCVDLSQNYIKYLLCLGKFLLHSKKFQSARSILRKLVELIKSLIISVEEFLQEDPEVTINEGGNQRFDKILKDMKVKYLGIAHHLFGKVYFCEEQFDLALFHFQKSKEVQFHGLNDEEEKKTSLNILNIIYDDISEDVRFYGVSKVVEKINDLTWDLAKVIEKERSSFGTNDELPPMMFPKRDFEIKEGMPEPSLENVLGRLTFFKFFRTKSDCKSMERKFEKYLSERVKRVQLTEMCEVFCLNENDEEENELCVKEMARLISRCDISTILSKPIYSLKLPSDDPLLEMVCGFCSKKVEKQLKCSKCKSVLYCDKQCQRSHWNVHKKVCSK